MSYSTYSTYVHIVYAGYARLDVSANIYEQAVEQ